MRLVLGTIILIILFLLGNFSCANQISLTGGPRDEIPPQLDTTSSFKNFQTNFIKQDIELNFDEFITLRNPVTQIVISPPLQYLPKMEGKGKRISIEFAEEEIIKDNATYVINFGQSITDFTEGNVLENFTLVYSTGDYIDSLTISGQVNDAFDNSPSTDVLVLLYESFEDSIVYTDRPFYFAKTLEDGSFLIENLRADTFRVIALQDLNLNYTFDPASEKIGFLDSLIVLTDSSDLKLEMDVFEEEQAPRYLAYEALNPGYMELQFNKTPVVESIRILDSVQYFISKQVRPGFLDLWYKPTGRTNLRIEIETDTEVDTISARINLRNLDPLTDPVRIATVNDNESVGLHPAMNLEITLDRPLSAINPDHIILIDTTSRDTIDFGLDSLGVSIKEFSLSSNWIASTSLEMTFFPGAFVDFFGVPNDTIQRELIVASEEDFGSIVIESNSQDSSGSYIVQLMKGELTIRSLIFDGNEEIQTFDRLAPDEYSLRIIMDRNNDGKWTAGNYLQKRQSEEIYSIEIESVRNNWAQQLNLQAMIATQNE